jgi:enterochelin esterase-like enzyme
LPLLALTSISLVIVLAGVAAILLGGVLVAWPRLAGSGARLVALRLIALCSVHATVLLLAFVIVNRANLFYSSWSDLLGQYTGAGTVVKMTAPQGPAASSAPVSVEATRPIRLPGRSQPAGNLQTVQIQGQLSGLRLPGYVYLPSGYQNGPLADRRYPVIVALSGVDGSLASGNSPYEAERLAAAAAAQIAAGRLPPLILVMLPAGLRSDPGCLNVPGGPQAALFFAQDLPAAIGAQYLASPQRSEWALLGDVRGGYCALQLALTNAATFAAVAVPSGAYQAPPGPHAWAAWGGSRQLRTQDNLAWLLRHQPMQPISLLLFGPGSPGAFGTQAQAPMHVTSASPATGPWPLAQVIDWLGREINAGRNHV